MKDIATLGIAVDSQQVVEADKKLDKLATTGKKAESVSKSFAVATTTSTQRLGGLGRTAGQAGIQIQQFVGQLQGGQSVLVALSQQAADLGFVLGLPLAGAVVSIGAALVGTLIPSLRDTQDEMEETESDSGRLARSFRELTKSAQGLVAIRNRAELEAVTAEINTAEASLRQLQRRIESRGGNGAQVEVWKSQVDRLNLQLGEARKRQEQLQGGFDGGGGEAGPSAGTSSSSEIDRYLEQLEQQSELLGKNSIERAVLTAEMKGGSAEQVAEAARYAGLLQAHKDMAAAIRGEARARAEEAQRILGIERRYESARKSVLSDEERLREAANDRSDAYGAAFEEGIISEDKYIELLESNTQLTLDQIAALDKTGEAAKRLANNIEETLQQNVQNSIAGHIRDGFDDGFEGVLESFGSLLLDMAAQAIAADLTASLFGDAEGGGNVAALAGGIGKIFGFADGGRPDPNRVSIVGERGPELFIPDGVSGTVVSNENSRAMLGGGGSVVQHIYVSGRPDNRTANQLANASAKKQQLAQSRFSG